MRLVFPESYGLLNAIYRSPLSNIKANMQTIQYRIGRLIK